MFEPREGVISKVIWNGEKEVEIITDKCSHWRGAKRQDFWNPDDNWESIIKPGMRIRYWTIQWSTILGFEIFKDCKWVGVWCMANHFGTKKDRKKSEDAYSNFIKSEGNKIAKLIDKGKSLEEIDKLISKGHSGNTHAWALSIGINKAKNKENADRVRKEHNKFWGIPEDKKGVVNPAVVTLST